MLTSLRFAQGNNQETFKVTKKEPKEKPTETNTQPSNPRFARVVRVEPNAHGRSYEPPTVQNQENFYKNLAKVRRLAKVCEARIASAALNEPEPVPSDAERRASAEQPDLSEFIEVRVAGRVIRRRRTEDET
jgi:hypothetical protein